MFDHARLVCAVTALVAGALSSAAVAQAQIPPRVRIPDPFDTTVTVPGGTEAVYVQTPWAAPAGRPLIVVFHGGYFDNHWEHVSGTPSKSLNAQLEALFDEAARRGWYAVSMTGGPNQFSGTFAGPELHSRTTAVISAMKSLYGVDSGRIYTLGYSMGGVDAVNYAARHVDPEGHMIAASWCWSGVLCAAVSAPGCALVPCNPLDRIAASVVQSLPCNCSAPSGSFVSDESLGWNLEHVTLTTTAATIDICAVECPVPALVALTAGWAAPANHTHLANHGATHDDPSAWDPLQICNFFQGKTVALPTSATRTVAVEDARYFYFDVVRSSSTETGTFGWSFSGQQLDVSSILRTTALQLDVDGGVDCPLDSLTDITIDLTPDPGFTQGTHVVLRHFANAAGTVVYLNGSLATPGTDYDWLAPDALILYRKTGTGTTSWLIDVP
ncbi:MAG: hypothetical protein IPM29_11700 [Planctomycetes bacterium]|nr:hypothetical protein [Planctomycetota bacterium]